MFLGIICPRKKRQSFSSQVHLKLKTMSRAEKFIEEHTRNCSNQYDLPECFENGIERLKEYQPWLTPDQARKAVEIAREEIYEWLSYHLDTSKIDVYYKFDVIEELRKAMRNE